MRMLIAAISEMLKEHYIDKAVRIVTYQTNVLIVGHEDKLKYNIFKANNIIRINAFDSDGIYTICRKHFEIKTDHPQLIEQILEVISK